MQSCSYTSSRIVVWSDVILVVRYMLMYHISKQHNKAVIYYKLNPFIACYIFINFIYTGIPIVTKPYVNQTITSNSFCELLRIFLNIEI